MKLTHWLMIAHTVSTLLVPFIAGYVVSRRSKETLNPNTNQPKPLIKRIGSWLVAYRWPIFLFISAFSLSIYNFTLALQNPDLPIRTFVIHATAFAATVTFLVTSLVFVWLFSLTFANVRRATKMITDFNLEAVRETREWLKQMTEAVAESSARIESTAARAPTQTPTQSTSPFDRILEKLRKLTS